MNRKTRSKFSCKFMWHLYRRIYMRDRCPLKKRFSSFDGREAFFVFAFWFKINKTVQYFPRSDLVTTGGQNILTARPPLSWYDTTVCYVNTKSTFFLIFIIHRSRFIMKINLIYVEILLIYTIFYLLFRFFFHINCWSWAWMLDYCYYRTLVPFQCTSKTLFGRFLNNSV